MIFSVIILDITVEYSAEGKLFCEANTYPESEIKWYHNDTLIESLEDFDIIEDEHMLLIKNMNLNHTGTYNCEISNSEETRTFSSNVYISGLGNKMSFFSLIFMTALKLSRS